MELRGSRRVFNLYQLLVVENGMSTWYLSAIRVSAPQGPVVPGDTIEGSVRLDLQSLGAERVGEVRLNLRGISYSCVPIPGKASRRTDTSRRSIKRNGRSITDTVYLVKESTSIWRRGMPSSSSDVLNAPFKFTLPVDLPPSFDFADGGDSTRISYTLEAVPDHSGMRATRVEIPLTVVPDDPDGARVRPALDAGWEGSWTTKVVREQLRRGHGLVGDAAVEVRGRVTPSCALLCNLC